MKKLVMIVILLGLMSCSLSAEDIPKEDNINTEVQNSNENTNN